MAFANGRLGGRQCFLNALMTALLAINIPRTVALTQQYCSSHNTGSDFAAGMCKPHRRDFGAMANLGHFGRVHSLKQLPIERGLLHILRRLRFRCRSTQELLVLELHPSEYYIDGLLCRGVSGLPLRELRRRIVRSLRICGPWKSTTRYAGRSSQQLVHRGHLRPSCDPGYQTYNSGG